MQRWKLAVILIFSEDGELTIASGLEEVRRQCEGIDVLSDVFRFYDENGNALKPVFDKPVTQRRFLWFAWSVDSGEYHLETDPAFAPDPLWVAFSETLYLRSNKRFASVDGVKAFLRERGVTVDSPNTR